MKDKSKRDMERIKELEQKASKLTEDLFAKDQVCRDLMLAALKDNQCEQRFIAVVNAVRDDHWLRKQIPPSGISL